MDKTLYIVGLIAALVAGGFMVWTVLQSNGTLWRAAKAVYIIISLLIFYHATIYLLVIVNVFNNESYRIFVRPFTSLFLLAPAAIAIIHRPRRRKS